MTEQEIYGSRAAKLYHQQEGTMIDKKYVQSDSEDWSYKSSSVEPRGSSL